MYVSHLNPELCHIVGLLYRAPGASGVKWEHLFPYVIWCAPASIYYSQYYCDTDFSELTQWKIWKYSRNEVHVLYLFYMHFCIDTSISVADTPSGRLYKLYTWSLNKLFSCCATRWVKFDVYGFRFTLLYVIEREYVSRKSNNIFCSK